MIDRHLSERASSFAQTYFECLPCPYIKVLVCPQIEEIVECGSPLQCDNSLAAE